MGRLKSTLSEKYFGYLRVKEKNLSGPLSRNNEEGPFTRNSETLAL